MVVSLLVGVGIGAGIGVAGSQDGGEDAASPVTEASPTTGGSPTEAPEPSPTDEPVSYRLERSRVHLSLKLTEHSCYGSAGGLDTVEVRLAVNNRDSLPRDGSWDITYRIIGDEGGPIIGTFTLYGTGKYQVDEQVVSTPTCDTRPEITVSQVETNL